MSKPDRGLHCGPCRQLEEFVVLSLLLPECFIFDLSLRKVLCCPFHWVLLYWSSTRSYTFSRHSQITLPLTTLSRGKRSTDFISVYSIRRLEVVVAVDFFVWERRFPVNNLDNWHLVSRGKPEYHGSFTLVLQVYTWNGTRVSGSRNQRLPDTPTRV